MESMKYDAMDTGRSFQIMASLGQSCTRIQIGSNSPNGLAKLSADILMDKIQSMSNIDQETSSAIMLNDEQRNFVGLFLDTYEILDKDYFDYLEFATIVCTKAPVPIELLWRLHKAGILELSLYLTLNDSNAAFLNHFSTSLSEILCGRIAESQLANRIISDLSVAMLSRLMPTKSFLSNDRMWANSRKVISKVLNESTAKVMDFIFSENGEKNAMLNYPIMYELVRTNIFAESWVKPFCLQQLAIILCYGSSAENVSSVHALRFGIDMGYWKSNITGNFSVTALQAIAQQEMWTYKTSSKHLINIFIQLMIPLSVCESRDVLRQAVSKKSANWKSSLTFVTTFIVNHPEAATEIKNLINDLLKESFENLNSDSLMAAFLLARQASLEGPDLFQSYADWFQSNFGRLVNSLIDKKKTFSFFIEFLTNLIPYEPSCFLKIHLTRPPRVHPKYHHLYSEYSGCARMKINELKQANKGSSSDKTKDEEKTKCEVENALESFSKLGKIPSFVMEMSIFHKTYYIEKFLKLLLEPRQVPKDPDRKMKFIEALFKASKISTATHASYLKACHSEGKTLIEDMTVKELGNAIKAIGTSLVAAIDSNNSKGVSLLIDKLEKTVMEAITGEDKGTQTKHLTIELYGNQPETISTKILYMVLNTFCKVQMSLKAPNSSIKWEHIYFHQLLECIPSLHHPLYLRLWSLIIGKDHLRLNAEQISSIACLVFHLRQVEHKFPTVKFGDSAHNLTLVNSIGDELNTSTDEEELFSSRFLNGYFWTMVTATEHVDIGNIPKTFITKFGFLYAQRKSRKKRNSSEDVVFEFQTILYESEFFQKIISNKVQSK